jgi:hypothetical protein
MNGWLIKNGHLTGSNINFGNLGNKYALGNALWTPTLWPVELNQRINLSSSNKII